MTRLVAVAGALLAMASVARGQGEDAEEPPGPPDAKVEARAETTDGWVEVGAPEARLTLPGGKFMLTAVVEANLAENAVGKPISVAPDLWIGVHDRFSFGIIHSARAATGFLTGAGSGLCFRGEGACAFGLGEVYTFAGAEARIGLTEGGFALAFMAGAQARAFDPELVLSGKAGFLARIHSSRIAIELAPAVYIGMTQRDFNPDQFGAPVTIFLRLAGSFSLAVQGGVAFILDDVGNTWRVPAAAGFSWWVTPHVSFDAAFGLAAVADSDDATEAFDARTVTVGLGYAL